MAAATACPVIGSTNTTLPPHHPDIDLSKEGQTCPIVGATTDHHHNLHKHPSVPLPPSDPKSPTVATACPALKSVVQQPQSQAMDDDICPVVGPATTVLPPNHPSTAAAKEDDVCPVTKASVAHHKQKVHEHPSVKAASEEKVCPVTGQRGVGHA